MNLEDLKLNKKGTDPERLANFKYTFFSDVWYMYVFLMIGALILYPISWLYFLINGIRYYNKKTIKYTGFESTPIYIVDKRYASGKRYKSTKILKSSFEMPATKSEIKFNRKKAMAYFLILIVVYLATPLLFIIIQKM